LLPDFSELSDVVTKTNGTDIYMKTINDYRITFVHANVGPVRYYKKGTSTYAKTPETETTKCISFPTSGGQLNLDPRLNPLKALDLYMLDTSYERDYRPAPYIKYWADAKNGGTIEATTNELSSSTTVIKGQDVRVIKVSFANISMPASTTGYSICNDYCLDRTTGERVENGFALPCDMYMMAFNDI
jgi:hypothetical protein